MAQCYRINSGKSITYNYTATGMSCVIAVFRYRSDTAKTAELYLIDSWANVIQLVNGTVGTAHTGVAISATSSSVTVTNNTTQGAVSAVILSGAKLTAV